MSTAVIGRSDLPAAIFIYQDDVTTLPAWTSVMHLSAKEGPIRGELHSAKAPFLAALRNWNLNSAPADTFLCIYSHAGTTGIAPVRHPTADAVIRWEELANALPCGVRYLWLLGCTTASAQRAWAAHPVPLAQYCLFTLASAPWQPFLQFFAREISVDDIVDSTQIRTRLHADSPELARLTEYTCNTMWRPRDCKE